jgi:tetratricopeptide (TPR) repeat protein
MERTSSSRFNGFTNGLALLVAAFVGAATLPPRAARAADSKKDAATAARAIERGIGLLKKGDYAEALAAFLEARELEPGPKSTAMVAQAEQVLKRWADAELNYTEALRAEDDPWIRRNRAGLERKLAEVRANLGRLAFASERVAAQDAEVRVNGILVGILPIKRILSVPIGPARIEVKAPGHEPFTSNVNVVPQETIRIQVTLKATPVALAPAGPADPSAPEVNPAPVKAAAPRDDAAAERRLSPWWGGAVAGAGALGIAGGALYLAKSADGCADQGCQDRWDPLGGKIAIGVGAAGLVAGGALLWYALAERDARVALGFDGHALSLAGRW